MTGQEEYPRFISNRPCGNDKYEGKSQGKGGNQRAENEGGGGERHHSHSGRGELTFRRQQG